MPRLDIDRQKELEPKRMAFAIKALEKAGFNPIRVNESKIEFNYLEEVISFWPYSGWHSGKSIKDGRGIENLLKQLK